MGRKKKQDLKKAVHFKMGFRNYNDPLYYENKGNDKIFIPQYYNEMTDEQKKIIDSFPEQDRGIFKENMDIDPLEGAVIKQKIKQKKVRFENDNESEQLEEEYDQELEEKIKMVEEKIIDINKQKQVDFDICDGVKFNQYDEYGLPKDDGFDYNQFICQDKTVNPNDIIIEAPQQMKIKNEIRVGVREDLEKEVSLMNEEEKAVFKCLQDENEEYEELEDDFILQANEGKQPIILKDQQQEEEEEKEDLIVIEGDEIQDRLKEIKELMKQYNTDEQVNQQEELDQNFQQIIQTEYNDNQIGDLSEDDNLIQKDNLISEDMLDEAVDEFIQDQKFQDRKLYNKYGQKDDQDQPDKLDNDTIKKSLFLNQQYMQEAEDMDSDDLMDIIKEDKDELKYDCQSIVSSYTNLDNHPGLIKRVIKKQNEVVSLDQQVKINFEGLIDNKKVKIDKQVPFEVVEEIVEQEVQNDQEMNEKQQNKLRKKQIKQERKEKRQLKKEVKNRFKNHQEKINKQNNVQMGEIKPGTSIRKIN